MLKKLNKSKMIKLCRFPKIMKKKYRNCFKIKNKQESKTKLKFQSRKCLLSQNANQNLTNRKMKSKKNS